jgi:hypothetical protein
LAQQQKTPHTQSFVPRSMATRQAIYAKLNTECENLVSKLIHEPEDGLHLVTVEAQIASLKDTLSEDLRQCRGTIDLILNSMISLLNPQMIAEFPTVDEGKFKYTMKNSRNSLVEPHHLMICNIIYQIEYGILPLNKNIFGTVALGFVYSLLALANESAANEDLEYVIRDEVNKHILAWKVEIEAQVQQLDLQVKNFLAQSHNLVMQGVNGLTLMTMDRLSNLQYLRYPSMRDPALIEGGCFNAFNNEDPENFKGWMSFLSLNSVDGPTVRCGKDGCGFATQLKNAFDPVNSTKGRCIVICCSRHQYELENTPEVGIEVTIMKRVEEDGQQFTVYANVVKNGRVLY